MAFQRVLAVSLAVAALGENHTRSEPYWPDGILDAPPAQWWLGQSGFSNCRNRFGETFPCGETGRCCGDICANDQDVCCKNVNGNDFACDGDGGGCCGNACYAKGSKCCKVGSFSEWYPVSQDTECTAKSSSGITCTNRFGDKFRCGANSRCGGDICVTKESKVCKNANGNDFACGPNSHCCGNACAGEGSKCCRKIQ